MERIRFIFLSWFVCVCFHCVHISGSKTDWISYRGCFGGLKNDNTKMKRHEILSNQPSLCSKYCKSYKRFALVNSTCYCFNDVVYNKFPRNSCFAKCPDFSKKMYCGSEDGNSGSVYERHPDLILNGSSDCLAVRCFNHTVLHESVECSTRLQYACLKTRPSERRSFYEAKLLCENGFSRLYAYGEIKCPNINNATKYWVGTFRSSKANAVPATETTPSTSTLKRITTSEKSRQYTATTVKISKTDVTRNKLKLTMHTSTTNNVDLETTVQTTMRTDLETINDNSEISEAMKGLNDEQTFKCGLYCMALTILVSVISILILLVCLFQLRQQWYKLTKQNQDISDGSNKKGHDKCLDNTKHDNLPIYLDPNLQKAVFHKKNTSERRKMAHEHHVYDQCKMYSTTETSKSKSTRPSSSYQSLKLTPKQKDELTDSFKKLKSRTEAFNDEVKNKSRCYDIPINEFKDPNYAKPWGKKVNSDDKSKDENDGANYADPWSNDPESDDETKESTRTARYLMKKLRSTGIFNPKKTHCQEPYEETEIDVRRFVYDKPTCKPEVMGEKEQWKNYRYQPKSQEGTSVLTPGRGLSVVNHPSIHRSATFTKTPQNPPDLILHDSNCSEEPSVSGNDEQLEGKLKTKKKTKRKKVMQRLSRFSLKSTIFSTGKRPHSEAEVEHVYETPNPIGRSAANTRSLLVNPESIGLRPLQQSQYRFQRDHRSNYELARPIVVEGETTQELDRRMPTAPRLNNIYAVAQPITSSSSIQEETNETRPIYFEPVV